MRGKDDHRVKGHYHRHEGTLMLRAAAGLAAAGAGAVCADTCRVAIKHSAELARIRRLHAFTRFVVIVVLGYSDHSLRKGDGSEGKRPHKFGSDELRRRKGGERETTSKGPEHEQSQVRRPGTETH